MLFKNSRALEEATRLSTVVLDKTGTITEGRPTVTDVVPVSVPGIDEDELVALVASVEKGSEHPLGRAIVSHADSIGSKMRPMTGFQAHGGHGVEASVDNRCIRVGRPDWFDDQSGMIASEV